MLFMDLVIMLCCLVGGCDNGGSITNLFSDGAGGGSRICVGGVVGGTTGVTGVSDDCLDGICPEGGTTGMVEMIVGFPACDVDDRLVEAE